ncbi:MAG: hypothetical protein K8S13_06935 [Desulfobacula sp.]|uniref:DAPG hydrolase family protein n=1 Tax=Desulfobacula sp. TaxID=2593537 RepID=UPI0025C65D9D|nr:hypothetical protein [Desulfobacula sp.]MCD4719582.1 hypothetical protein [Desulfobacula sp.]
MFIEEANKLLEPGYLPMETGYQRLSNGQMYVAVLVRMPRCKGKMVDWWFGYMGDTEKYKLWHPKDHISGEWENWSPGNYIGATHVIKEYMGGEIMKGKAYFRDPSEFFDTSRFDEAKVGAAICADGRSEENVQRAQLIHFARDTEFGCEMRSCFWLFHADEARGAAVMKHCYEEMGYLADFLPDLYVKETAIK